MQDMRENILPKFIYSDLYGDAMLVSIRMGTTWLPEGGERGVRKPQNRTEIRQKPQTASDFFPNTETARTWRPQYES